MRIWRTPNPKYAQDDTFSPLWIVAGIVAVFAFHKGLALIFGF